MANEGNSKDEASELERLRAENITLKEELAAGEVRKGSFWRSFLVWLLIVLACIFAFSGAIAVWVRATTLDTDVFVDTVAPLIQEDEVARVISQQAVEALFEEVGIADYLEQALPEDLEFVAEPLSDGLEAAAELAAREILTSDQFQWVWENALRLAHSQAIRVIQGEDGIELTEEGQVILDIGALLTDIRDRLVEDGMDFLENVPIPESAGQIVLFEDENIGMIKGAVNLLDDLKWMLPILAFVFFLAAVVIAEDRRKALLGAGIGLAIAMAISLVALRLARAELLGQIENADVRAAAEVVWNRLFAGLVGLDWGVFTLGVLVAIGAAIAGPYSWAVSLRKKTSDFFEGWRERRKEGEKESGPIGAFITEYAWGLRIAGAAIAIIVLLLLPTLSAVALIITVAVYLVYLAVIEILR